MKRVNFNNYQTPRQELECILSLYGLDIQIKVTCECSDGTTEYVYVGRKNSEIIFDMNAFYLSNDIDLSKLTGIQVVELTSSYDFIYAQFFNAMTAKIHNHWIEREREKTAGISKIDTTKGINNN